jgi:pyruvate dehydrogenase E1 component alpha subunit
VFLIENNRYAMGTSTARAASNPNFYKRGDVIPGLQVEGNNVLMVRETLKYVKKYCVANGPLFLEVSTYRYHG